MGDCCKTGFNWGGTPTGTETTIAGFKAYKAGTSKKAAIYMIHDVFGWTFPNLRLLADHFAKEADATVYLPDHFDGEVIDPSTLEDPAKRAQFDIKAFVGRHSKEARLPGITAVARQLRADGYPKVGAIGYCYGGWACLRLAAGPSPLVDAISIAHPSLVEPAELDACAAPCQICAPETDPAFTPELKEHANRVLPAPGGPPAYEYVYFPGVAHGFAAKGDRSDPLQRASLERAKNSAVNFFKEFLH
ncbi:endo-1,3-1,4-beta-D-glucanase [Xylariaceae sp. FL0804]|nr:endo-1,3-1,4-beta-D-glucanase [Xylariaceae sp. FL0804]